MATRQFANLSSYRKAVDDARGTTNLLDSLIQGAQQGIQLQRLPQTLQDQGLARDLQNAINLQKLQDLQNPERALARRIQEELTVKGALNPNLGITRADPTLIGETIATPGALSADQQAALLTGGAVPTVAPSLPVTPVSAFGIQTGLNVDPNVPIQADEDKLNRQLRLLTSRPETFSTVVSDQGIMRVGNRSTEAVPLVTAGGGTVQAPVKPAASDKITRFSDANGNLFQQSTSGGAATPVVDANGAIINIGVPNRVIESDQGVMTVPTRAQGTPVATPITSATPAGTPLTRTKTAQEKPLTDSQANFQLYGNRMEEADKTLDELSGFDPIEGADLLPNRLKSEERQRVERAERDFLNAVLRKESGATITPDEMANGRRQYFRVAGDDDKTIADKKANRQRVIADFKRLGKSPTSQSSTGNRIIQGVGTVRVRSSK